MLPSEWPWLLRNQRETLFLYLPGLGLGGIWIGFKIGRYCIPSRLLGGKRWGGGLAGDSARVFENALEVNV